MGATIGNGADADGGDLAPAYASGHAASDDPAAALLLRCARGDRAALRGLYDQEAGRMLGIALRILRRRDLAEEALQQAFVQVWTKASGFDAARGPARGWLHAVARNCALHAARQHGRFQPLGEQEDAADESEDALERLGRRADGAALRACLQGLERRRRTLVVLAFQEGLTHADLVQRTGLPLGTVKSWIRRSLLSLRDCLAHAGTVP